MNQLIYNFNLMIWKGMSCSYRSLLWSSEPRFLATVQDACLTPCLVTVTEPHAEISVGFEVSEFWLRVLEIGSTPATLYHLWLASTHHRTMSLS